MDLPKFIEYQVLVSLSSLYFKKNIHDEIPGTLHFERLAAIYLIFQLRDFYELLICSIYACT